MGRVVMWRRRLRGVSVGFQHPQPPGSDRVLLSCAFSVVLRSPVSFSQRLCPAGRFGEAPGLTSAACSGECLLGYECPAGSVVATASVCPVGFYCSGGPKQACPAGCYSDVTATVSEAACMACPAGELCAFVM
jgi:hypothetical protein